MNSLRVLTVDITSRCPNRCIHCESEKGSEYIPFINLTRIIGDASALGLSDVVVSGGEPLTYPELYELVKYCHEKNIYLSLLTSGTAEFETELTRLLQYVNIAFIRISLESTDPRKLDRLRGSMDNMEKIDHLIRMVKRYGVPFGISCTVSRENEDEISEIFAFAVRKKAAFVRFVPYISSTRGNSYPFDKLLYRVLDTACTYTAYIRSGIAPLPDRKDELIRLFKSPCPAGVFTGYIDVKSQLRLCPFLDISAQTDPVSQFSTSWAELQRMRKSVFTSGSSCLIGNMYSIESLVEEYTERVSLLSRPINSPARKLFSRIIARQKEIVSTGLVPCWRSSPLLLFPLHS